MQYIGDRWYVVMSLARILTRPTGSCPPFEDKRCLVLVVYENFAIVSQVGG